MFHHSDILIHDVNDKNDRGEIFKFIESCMSLFYNFTITFIAFPIKIRFQSKRHGSL
jgi:hypothetical protein